MQLLVRPKVVLVSSQTLDIGGLETFLNSHDVNWDELQATLESDIDLAERDGEWLVETAGRLCYMSFGKGRTHEQHLQHVIEVGHGSVLEHANYTFLVWGVSRSLTHELVRHRAGFGYSQLSQRYVDESNTDFVVPSGLQMLEKLNPGLYAQFVAHLQASSSLYVALIAGLMEVYGHIEDQTERRKKARSAARAVLPNATETKIVVTGNARALRHFIEMRAHPAAELEIRMLAVEIFRIMQRVAPALCHGMKIVALPDETLGVESEFRKV